MAREFRIHRIHSGYSNSLNFENFEKEIEKEINENEELINSAKKCNTLFAEEVRKIVDNSENDLFTGTMVAFVQSHIHRYAFIKNLKYQEQHFEAKIDLLERTFILCEV